MDVKQIMTIRKQAEEAVADMPDGTLKLKAFEIILSNLLGDTGIKPSGISQQESGSGPKKRRRQRRKSNPGEAAKDVQSNSAAGQNSGTERRDFL